MDEVASAMLQRDWKDNTDLVVIDRAAFNQGANAAYEPHIAITDVMDPLVARGPHALAYTKAKRAQSPTDDESWVEGEVSPTLNGFDVGDTRATTVVAATGSMIRRLTPIECERLQGFPDGWTNVGSAGKPTPDSHRYKQLGNAVTVNVAKWIASRARPRLEVTT
jgi:site-specific DNA-cytosine methylase